MNETVGRRGFLGGLVAVGAFAATGCSYLSGNGWDHRVAQLSVPLTRPPGGARRIGAAVRPEHLVAGTAMAALVSRQCDFLVPEFHGQWSAVEWERGKPWYGNLDAIAAFARAQRKSVRGHALIWEKMTPKWARAAMLEERDWRIVETHFASLLPRFADTDEWIVVNECIDTENGEQNLQRNSFQQAFGNGYVARALETARELAPHARLLINDYSVEYSNPIDEARRTALLKLVERLRHDGTPLDGVGVQAHLELAKGPVAARSLAKFFDELQQMNVDIAITELDVLEDHRGAPIERRDARVADAVDRFMDVVNAQTGVSSLATWGLSDKDSWLQERAAATRSACACSPIDCAGMNRGLPYDGELMPKPMLSALTIA